MSIVTSSPPKRPADFSISAGDPHCKISIQDVTPIEKKSWALDVLLCLRNPAPNSEIIEHAQIQIAVSAFDGSIIAQGICDIMPLHGIGSDADAQLQKLNCIQTFVKRPGSEFRGSIRVPIVSWWTWNGEKTLIYESANLKTSGTFSWWCQRACFFDCTFSECTFQDHLFLPGLGRSATLSIKEVEFIDGATALIGCSAGWLFLRFCQWPTSHLSWDLGDQDAVIIDVVPSYESDLRDPWKFVVLLRIKSGKAQIRCFPSGRVIASFALATNHVAKLLLGGKQWIRIAGKEAVLTDALGPAQTTQLWPDILPENPVTSPVCLPPLGGDTGGVKRFVHVGETVTSDTDARLAAGCRGILNWNPLATGEDARVIVSTAVFRAPWEAARGRFDYDIERLSLRSEAFDLGLVDETDLLECAEKLGCLSYCARKQIQDKAPLGGIYAITRDEAAGMEVSFIGRATELGWLSEPACQPFRFFSGTHECVCYIDRGGWIVCHQTLPKPVSTRMARLRNPDRADCYAVSSEISGQIMVLSAHSNLTSSSRRPQSRPHCPLQMQSGTVQVFRGGRSFCTCSNIDGICLWARTLPETPKALACSRASIPYLIIGTSTSTLLFHSGSGDLLRIISQPGRMNVILWQRHHAMLAIAEPDKGIKLFCSRSQRVNDHVP